MNPDTAEKLKRGAVAARYLASYSLRIAETVSSQQTLLNAIFDYFECGGSEPKNFFSEFTEKLADRTVNNGPLNSIWDRLLVACERQTKQSITTRKLASLTSVEWLLLSTASSTAQVQIEVHALSFRHNLPVTPLFQNDCKQFASKLNSLLPIQVAAARSLQKASTQRAALEADAPLEFYRMKAGEASLVKLVVGLSSALSAFQEIQSFKRGEPRAVFSAASEKVTEQELKTKIMASVARHTSEDLQERLSKNQPEDNVVTSASANPQLAESNQLVLRFLIGEYAEWAVVLKDFHCRIKAQSDWFSKLPKRTDACTKELAATAFALAVAIEQEQTLIRALFKQAEAAIFLDDEKITDVRQRLSKTTTDVDRLTQACRRLEDDLLKAEYG